MKPIQGAEELLGEAAQLPQDAADDLRPAAGQHPHRALRAAVPARSGERTLTPPGKLFITVVICNAISTNGF